MTVTAAGYEIAQDGVKGEYVAVDVGEHREPVRRYPLVDVIDLAAATIDALREEASMNASRSPSRTSPGLVDWTPVRRSFTSW